MAAPFVHEPVAKGQCSPCHVAKQGERGLAVSSGCAIPTQLGLARGPKLCGKCHQPAPVFHVSGSGADEDPCLRCHDPHGGESAAELRDAEGGLCLACHQDDFLPPVPGGMPETDDVEAGSTPSPVPEVYEHGPVGERRCAPCHMAHAESPRGLVRGRLPVGAHALYRRSAYSACYGSCHDAALVEERRTKEATRFRNGDDNLHYRHVVRQDWGRSCSLCHAPHLASNRALIRSWMPFGKERLTLEFTPTELGGRCTTSCHITVEYDREDPVPSTMRIISVAPRPAEGGLP